MPVKVNLRKGEKCQRNTAILAINRRDSQTILLSKPKPKPMLQRSDGKVAVGLSVFYQYLIPMEFETVVDHNLYMAITVHACNMCFWHSTIFF